MSERIGKIFKHFVVAAFCAIVVVTLVQVFMRYVLSSPLTWAEELSRYIFVWAIMVSIGIGVVDEAHIRLNMVTTRFGKKAQFGFYLLGQVIMVAFNVILIVYGARLSLQNLSVMSPAMKIPIGIAYAGIPVGALVVLFFLGVDTWKKTQAYRGDKND
ncbi:TRAP transporter small permease [Dysosmobacter welbionis]|uniref:TRAP transporter small permease n=1 Tax=Dysosmobacter welbionis TaxID=2093857 RepID=UPI003A3DFE35